MTITASQVKELRERTGAGMMECKKALQASKGDIENAIEEMRKSGGLKAAKKSGRITAEGFIAIATSEDRKTAAMVYIACETDFVSRDEGFISFAESVAQRALAENVSDIDKLAAIKFDGKSSSTIEENRQELVSKIGENIQFLKMRFMTSDNCVANYKHGNRIGVLVDLSKGDEALGKDVAMHIAATHPLALSSDDISPELIAKEREIFSAQAESTGKPPEIIEKMVEGRIKKFLNESTLTGQPFVKNPDQTVGDLLSQSNAAVKAFERFEVGEGIERKEEDFAAEVAAQVRGAE